VRVAVLGLSELLA
jgi:hypothetical protein